MALNLNQLQRIWNLHQELDNLLEGFQFSQKDLKTSLKELFEFLKEIINISAFYVETKNEKLINTIYTFGKCDEKTKLRDSKLKKVNEIISIKTPDIFWYALSIDVDGHIIGTVAIGYNESDLTESDEFYKETIITISELIDTFIYNIQSSSIKHSLIMGLQEALADIDISSSLDRTTKLLHHSIKFKKMLIVYIDRDIIADNKNIKYILYDGSKRINDNNEKPLDSLENLVRSKKDFLSITPAELQQNLEMGSIAISYLTKGFYEEEPIGFICIETPNNQKLNTLAKELLQIFSEELRQRLVDLNREKNILRKYFSNTVITKLITTPNYEERYLKAREAEIGIIFADISGFTEMSEQILKTPERITNFINRWARGVVARVFPLGATLDKIIGDCAMFLFGPPFYTSSKEEIVKHMLQASQQIVAFTRNYLESPQNEDIKKHPDFKKFGVSIGINFCHCIVGLIGPNNDITAFSSGVNITARLQGLAGANEILVTESVKNIADSSNHNWQFSEKKSTKVKNVTEPLGYYNFISNR
ncbi:MAG: adenylate/guanylate cyclase domain-containing protein [Candidatus Riflebacteria bacterium]|nr:adenylate/guanylate cyclase domain-containing protein [Candidatus Riflebacteria bacterium]